MQCRNYWEMQPDEIKSECSSGRIYAEHQPISIFVILIRIQLSCSVADAYFLFLDKLFVIFATLHNGKFNFLSQFEADHHHPSSDVLQI